MSNGSESSPYDAVQVPCLESSLEERNRCFQRLSEDWCTGSYVSGTFQSRVA